MPARKEIDWNTVDLWDDVVTLLFRTEYTVPAWSIVLVSSPWVHEANVVATILYLRGSSKFQPSDTWRDLLDDAVTKVACRSVPWK